MILTRTELIKSLQKEVRLLLHLAGKVDQAALDYRPTPGQRSTLELLKYLSLMGPALLGYARGRPMDTAAMSEALQAAAARNFDQTLAAIAAHADLYAALLAEMSDDDFRAETKGVDGGPMTCGEFIVNQLIAQCAAYRMQLFIYLKASGHHELNSMNLWVGVDAPMPAGE